MPNADLEIFATIAVLGLSLLLAGVSLVSWRRTRNRRAAFIAMGFLVFAGQGGWLASRSYATRGSQDWLVPVALFDLGVLACLYLALRVP